MLLSPISICSGYTSRCRSCNYQENVTPTSSLLALIHKSRTHRHCRVSCPNKKCSAELLQCLLCDNYYCCASNVRFIKRHIENRHSNQSPSLIHDAGAASESTQVTASNFDGNDDSYITDSNIEHNKIFFDPVIIERSHLDDVDANPTSDEDDILSFTSSDQSVVDAEMDDKSNGMINSEAIEGNDDERDSEFMSLLMNLNCHDTEDGDVVHIEDTNIESNDLLLSFQEFAHQIPDKKIVFIFGKNTFVNTVMVLIMVVFGAWYQDRYLDSDLLNLPKWLRRSGQSRRIFSGFLTGDML